MTVHITAVPYIWLKTSRTKCETSNKPTVKKLLNKSIFDGHVLLYRNLSVYLYKI